MFMVYILESLSSHKYYIGCTDNVERRLKEHNSGLSKYTKNKGPRIIVYREEYNQLNIARKREKQVKSWHKRAAIEKLIKGAFV